MKKSVLAALFMFFVISNLQAEVRLENQSQQSCLRRQNRLRTISRLNDHGFEVLKIHRVEATAYAIGDGYTPGVTTRSGRPAKKGSIAVDPKLIALNTELYVPGYGWGRASDTGGAIKGHRIDIFLTSKKMASDYGRQELDVYIIQPKPIPPFALGSVLMDYLNSVLRPIIQRS